MPCIHDVSNLVRCHLCEAMKASCETEEEFARAYAAEFIRRNPDKIRHVDCPDCKAGLVVTSDEPLPEKIGIVCVRHGG